MVAPDDAGLDELVSVDDEDDVEDSDFDSDVFDSDDELVDDSFAPESLLARLSVR